MVRQHTKYLITTHLYLNDTVAFVLHRKFQSIVCVFYVVCGHESREDPSNYGKWVYASISLHFYDVCITAVDPPQCYTFKAWKNHSNYWMILVIVVHWYMLSQVNHCSICVCLFTESPWFGRRHFWVEYIFCFFGDLLMIYLWFWLLRMDNSVK